MSKKHIAIYVRVSSKKQELRSQIPDLEHYAAGQTDNVKWYRDKVTGRKTTDGPGWRAIEDGLRLGKISCLVCWKICRLGRTARGLTALFAELIERKVNLIAIKDGVDLSTPAGRMLANVLASLAQYELETLSERQAAGIAAAHAAGKRWGGSPKGKRKKVTPVMERTIARMRKDGESITAIAKTVGLTRHTIYSVLKDLHQN